MTSTENWKKDFVEFFKNRGKIQTLAELEAVQDLRLKAQENRLNSEAEAAYVRKHVWGQESTPAESEESVRDTILGDVTYQMTAPQSATPPTPSNSNPLATAAAIALGALIPTTGLAALGGYVASKYLNPPAPINQPSYEDQSLQIGLSKFEDLDAQD